MVNAIALETAHPRTTQSNEHTSPSKQEQQPEGREVQTKQYQLLSLRNYQAKDNQRHKDIPSRQDQQKYDSDRQKDHAGGIEGGSGPSPTEPQRLIMCGGILVHISFCTKSFFKISSLCVLADSMHLRPQASGQEITAVNAYSGFKRPKVTLAVFQMPTREKRHFLS